MASIPNPLRAPLPALTPDPHESAHRRHRRRKPWGCLIFLAACVLLAGLTYWLWKAMSADQPTLAADQPELSKLANDQLVMLFRRYQPQDRTNDETVTLDLDEAETNLLLLLVRPPNPHLRWQFRYQRGRFRGDLSVAAEGFLPNSAKWLNVQADFTMETVERELLIAVTRLRVGEVQVPAPLARFAVGLWMRTKPMRDVQERLFELVQRLKINDDGHVEIHYWAKPVNAILQELFPELRQVTVKPEPADVKEYVKLIMAQPLDTGAEDMLRLTMAKAGERAKADSTYAKQNMAALVALGLACGNPELDRSVGLRLSIEERGAIHARLGKMRLAGRTDLSQRFFEAAGASLLKNPRLVFAEATEHEVRATLTGSGMSYRRLLASYAGIVCAECMTGTEARAQRMQEQFSRAFLTGVFFPTDLGDFPEGVKADDFETKFGGAQGPRHAQILDDIQRVVRRCEAYR